MTAAERTTETGLALPSLATIVRIAGRAFRGKCPNCGRAPVLSGWATVRPGCTACGFRFERSDDGYFVGALFANLLLSESIFAGGFLVALVLTWPDVPWDALTYGGAAGMLSLPALTYPLSKVLWLAIDVCVRPVTPAELLPQ
ncbi:MAG TPA: DUF983 domain-containing protein [Gemmatimonas sp.]|nr:DUF983 domain-containing protein [Gemmatimonas sp.]